MRKGKNIMFKNILKFLFEEEEEDLIEEPLEEVSLSSSGLEKKEEKKPMKQKPAVKPCLLYTSRCV